MHAQNMGLRTLNMSHGVQQKLTNLEYMLVEGDIGEIVANLWWKALMEEEEKKEGGEDLGGEKVDDMVHFVKP